MAHEHPVRAADDRGCRTVSAGGGCPDDDRGADQCGDRVQPLSEHDGDLADVDVAEDAAADARDRAEDDGGCGGEAVVECLVAPVTQKRSSRACTPAMTPLSPNANAPARLRTSSSIWFLLGVHQRGRQPFRSEHAIAGRA